MSADIATSQSKVSTAAAVAIHGVTKSYVSALLAETRGKSALDPANANSGVK